MNKPSKSGLKRLFTENIGYKLLSVVGAIILWMVVVNVSDYQITKRIKDIPVEELNAETLDQLDKVYDIESGDKVDIIVKGRRSVVEGLDASDFKATADLSTMSITNSVVIDVSAKNQTVADAINITVVDSTMKLKLEEKTKAQFSVNVVMNGVTADGYYACASVATPNIITIEGPETSVSKVTEVVATVDVDKRHDTFNAVSDIVLFDAYGDVIENNKLSLSATNVRVNVEIFPVTAVDVVVNVNGVPATGYGIKEVNYQPQTVYVAGAEADIAKFERVAISNLSVSGLTSTFETTVSLEDYLPRGIYLAQNNTEEAITVVIEKIEEKTIEVKPTDINLKNRNTLDYEYVVTLGDDFELTCEGLASDIESLDMDYINAVVDCMGLGPGHHKAKVDVGEVDGVVFNVEGYIYIDVTRK